jgi:hypothetical protein
VSDAGVTENDELRADDLVRPVCCRVSVPLRVARQEVRMPKPPRPWTVMPHGPLVRLDDNLWAVESDVPGIPALRRRMSIFRRADGRLTFYNAVPLADATLAELRALGEPAFLVVPHPLHMLDAHAFRARLGVRVYAPALTRALVAAGVEVDGAFEDLPADPGFTVASAPGFKTGEGHAVVRTGPRATLLVADAVVNVRRGAGVAGLLFHLLGMTGDRPKLPVPVRLRVVRDRAALRAHLERCAAIAGLARVVPSHGAVIERDPAGVLREIAARL